MIPLQPMTQDEKLLARMRNNPRNWTIADLKRIANRYGIDFRQPGTSHVTFSFPAVIPVTVPADRRIKPIYIKLFLAMIDAVEAQKDETDG